MTAMKKHKTKTTVKRKTPQAGPIRETGDIVKDWGGRLPVALIYPNTYYLGMSNLGVHTIYQMLNRSPDIVCERVFLDSANERGLPVSIESERPLADFAVLAFSISYELDYFNVVRIMEAAGIPPLAADRDERHPLVIAGGPCITANPLPVAPFFDCLGIGEAEPILPELLPVLHQYIGEDRRNLLQSLTALSGIYVPALPPETPVVRRYAADLDSFATTSSVFTEDTELGELFLIEAERGCQRGCRFCLVNTTFAPMRFRSPENLLVEAKRGLEYRKRIGLVGPAVTDHPRILELLAGLNEMGAETSVSSLRISSISGEILRELARGKARTVTIAPEAGPERLRRLVNKRISEKEILDVAGMVGDYRFRQLKMYFIIGLPTETDEEAAEIADLTLKIKSQLDRRPGGTRLAVNITPFVPKAGTPFQWLPMASRETLERGISLLKEKLPSRGVKLNAESSAWSRVQGVLARGDERLAAVIAATGGSGLAAWRRAVSEHRLDEADYIDRRRDVSEKLPWSFIDSGTTEEHLCREMEKALQS